MPERLIIVGLVAVAVTLAILAAKRWSAGRVQGLIDATPVDKLWGALKETPDGRKTLVTFSSPSCAACHTAQAPAINKVEEQLGRSALRVITVDAARQPDVAQAFGVMTVPSTVLLAPAGQIVAVNQGFAPSGKLVEQLQRT